MASSAEPFEGWAILEIMGHRQVAGLVREVNVFGAQMARVDIPDVPAVEERWSHPEGTPGRYLVRDTQPAIPGFTQFYGGGSVFCMTPVTEAVARAAAARFRQAPPKALDIAPSSRQLGAADDDDLEDAEVIGDDEPLHAEDADDADNQVPGR